MGRKNRTNGQINICRTDRPWLRRVWAKIAKRRGQTVQEMVIETVHERFRSEDEELNNLLRMEEELKKP